MTRSDPARPLRRILAFDAASGLLMGLPCIAASGPIAAATGLPQTFVFVVGLLLLPVTVFFAAGATGRIPARFGGLVAALGNAAWVVASIVALMALAPNALGAALVTVQAVVVAVFGWLEWRALPAPRSATLA
jgi:hypothetical protein